MRAQGIILGCTELGLLIGAEDCRVPIFDTTSVHALAAVEQALKQPCHRSGLRRYHEGDEHAFYS